MGETNNMYAPRQLKFPPHSRLKRQHRPTGMLLALSCLLSPAAPARAEGMEVLARYGQDGGSYESAGLGLRFGSWWAKDLGGWKATLRPELELNHFRFSGTASGPDNLNEAGGMGLLRFDRGTGGVQPYGEIGLGLAYFSHDRLGEKNFSTHYQFSEHLGLGMEFAERWFAGYRFSHYSNADIKKPNNGMDLHQLVIGVRF